MGSHMHRAATGRAAVVRRNNKNMSQLPVQQPMITQRRGPPWALLAHETQSGLGSLLLILDAYNIIVRLLAANKSCNNFDGSLVKCYVFARFLVASCRKRALSNLGHCGPCPTRNCRISRPKWCSDGVTALIASSGPTGVSPPIPWHACVLVCLLNVVDAGVTCFEQHPLL